MSDNKFAFPITGFSHSERLRASGGGPGDRRDQSPFLHSVHGNPAFTPQKAGKASAASVSRKVWSTLTQKSGENFLEIQLNNLMLLVGLKIAQATKAPREAAHAVHAVLAQAMGQRQEYQSRAEALGDRKENRKREKIKIFAKQNN